MLFVMIWCHWNGSYKMWTLTVFKYINKLKLTLLGSASHYVIILHKCFYKTTDNEVFSLTEQLFYWLPCKTSWWRINDMPKLCLSMSHMCFFFFSLEAIPSNLIFFYFMLNLSVQDCIWLPQFFSFPNFFFWKNDTLRVNKSQCILHNLLFSVNTACGADLWNLTFLGDAPP